MTQPPVQRTRCLSSNLYTISLIGNLNTDDGFSLRDYFTATLSGVSMARSEDRSPYTYDRSPLFNRDLVIIRHAHRELW